MTRSHRKCIVGTTLALCAWLTTPAHAMTVYSNNFQGTVGSEWSRSNIASAPNPDYGGTRRFLGEFGNDIVSLSLGALPGHTQATVYFDLYLIRSWDGNATNVINNDPLGPDRWQVQVGGGPLLLDTTFSNGNPSGQAYAPNPSASSCNTGYNSSYPSGTYNPMTGASECYSLGYTFDDPLNTRFGEHMDSVYNLGFTFNHSDSSLMLNFAGMNLQGLTDESWGLDNVRVEVSPVPLPGAFGLLIAGLTVLFGLKRKRVV